MKVLEFQRCNSELGIEKSISTKSHLMLEVISYIIDHKQPNNGCSIGFTVDQVNSLSKDGLLTSAAESG